MTTTPIVGDAITFSNDPLAGLPTITALSDDTFIFAWQDGSDVFARHLNETGSFTTGNFLQELSSANQQPLANPHLYQQADGSLMLDFNLFPSGTESDVFGHRLNGNFSLNGGFIPLEGLTGAQILVDSAATTNGGLVAFEVRVGNNFHTDLRFVDANGQPVGNVIFLGPNSGESEQDATIAGLGNGNAVVVYQKVNDATGARDIRFEIVSPDGHHSGGVPISMAQFNGGFPNVAVLKDGSFVAAWQATDGIEMRHMLEFGQIFSGVVKIAGTEGAFLPKVTALKDGSFMVAWTQGSGTESDGSTNLDVFLQRFAFNANNDFVGVGDKIHLEQPGDQGLFNLDIATLADGRVVISYVSETGDATNVNRLDYRIIDPRDDILTGSEQNDKIVTHETSSLVMGQGGNDTLIGRFGNDTLQGGAGNDTIDPGLNNDRLDGGAGNDTANYLHEGTAVTVNLLAGTARGQGNDTLTGIENVIGSAGSDNITGDNGSNILDGSVGADTLRGLGGNDTYIVENSGDRAIEATGGGSDTVSTTVDYALEAGQAIEFLSATTADHGVRLTGNEFAQTLTGSVGNDRIDGKGGADTMQGGAGDDIFIVDNAGDVVQEWQEWGANDQVVANVSYALGAGVFVETLRTGNAASTIALNLAGNALAQTIQGNAGVNLIDGRGGADSMAGLGGNDTYVVDDAKDVVVELAGQGTLDQVIARVDYVLGAGVQVERLSSADAEGTGLLHLVGNEFAQTIVGNDGSNALEGKGGADTMVGRGGDDFYTVDNAGDRVVEVAHGGSDIVVTSVSYTLQAGSAVEGLVTSDQEMTTAMNLTGNEFAQGLFGNDGKNILDGKGGADNMAGFLGDDTYIVDNGGDEVSERVGEGTDRVLSSVSYELGAGQSIEQLQTANTAGNAAIDLTGNSFGQAITGNAGNNVIAGLGGNDVLSGLGGQDSFLFNSGLNAATNVDRITDFSTRDDTIRLENAVFAALAKTGALPADAFFAGAAAHDASDHIIYNAATGALIYDSNGNAAGGATQFATLSPGLALTANDFLVV